MLDGGRGAEGRCHGNQFWDAICFDWLCVNDSDRGLVMEGV